MQLKISGLKLKMVEIVQLPDQNYDKVKKEWVKNGLLKDYLKYTFISNDEFKQKYIFQKEKAKGDYSNLEDKSVDLLVSFTQSDFQGKLQNRFTLDAILESKSE